MTSGKSAVISKAYYEGCKNWLTGKGLSTLAAQYSVPTNGCRFCRSDHCDLDSVEGRILVHGEEENGRSYMMLESTEAKVYAIHHTQKMQEMRRVGGLQGNSFVCMDAGATIDHVAPRERRLVAVEK